METRATPWLWWMVLSKGSGRTYRALCGRSSPATLALALCVCVPEMQGAANGGCECDTSLLGAAGTRSALVVVRPVALPEPFSSAAGTRALFRTAAPRVDRYTLHCTLRSTDDGEARAHTHALEPLFVAWLAAATAKTTPILPPLCHCRCRRKSRASGQGRCRRRYEMYSPDTR